VFVGNGSYYVKQQGRVIVHR